jgi:hypothetical protein
VTGPESKIVKVRRYRSRRRKSFLRRHKMALPAAGILLYGGLMAAVASSGNFPLSLIFGTSQPASSETDMAGPPPDADEASKVFPREPLPEVATDLPEGTQLSSLETAGQPADQATDTESLEATLVDEEAGPTNTSNTSNTPEPSNDSSGSRSTFSSLGSGSFSPGGGTTSGLFLYPIGRSGTTPPPSFDIAGLPQGFGSPPAAGNPKEDDSKKSCDSSKTDDTSQDGETKETDDKTDACDSQEETDNTGTQASGTQQTTGNDPVPQQDGDGPTNPPILGDDPPPSEPVDAPVIQVPEPGTLALVSPALLALWRMRRRRRLDAAG